MKHVGPHIGKSGVENSGFNNLKTVYWNLLPEALYEEAIQRGEGRIAKNGPLAVVTGLHTGRSATDKFIVRDDATRESVWWENTAAMAPEKFDLLYEDFMAFAEGRDLFVQDLFGGADPAHRLPTRVFCQYAWHALFIRYLLRRPDQSDLENFAPEFTIICLPEFKADPQRHGVNSATVIACNYSKRIVLIGGSSYAGEIKKSVFGMLNFDLPAKGVMPMHCSANVGSENDAAVFFGLSGTGKTTLSADPNRTLIGDDEHGWSENGIFNFEGGCYAKTIRLSAEAEPEIYATTQRFGSVVENVMMDADSREFDFDDTSLTENGRVAYPMDYIQNGSSTGVAGHPQNIIMLTADAFGILPPISRLTPAQAMYHFLSGYTAKVAGTEKGLTEPTATFSTCFGAPFMPRHPSVYGNLLRDLIAKHNVSCWLVNTGWTGGRYGVGSRMPIKATRALLAAALDGSLKNAEMRIDANFGFEVPVALEGIDAKILTPRATWQDPLAYDAQAAALVQMFIDNFEKFEEYVDPDVRAAAPVLRAAAE